MNHRDLILFFILFIFCSHHLYSQPVYFNNRYNLCQNYNEEAWSGADDILQVDDGYVITGYTVDTSIYWWRRIPILKISSDGQPVFYKSYGDTLADYYTGWSGHFKKSNFNEIYYIAGVKEFWQPENYAEGLLMAFNEEFDTLWTRTYNLNSDPIPDTNVNFTQLNLCYNSDLIFAGSMNGSHMLLLRTDSSGNTSWYKLFHFGGNTLCTGYSAIPTSDNGFALGGFRYTIGQPETGNPVIVKTDSLGNQEWVKYMGGPLLDHVAFLVKSNDGNIVMGSTYGDEMQGNDPISRINIAKLDNYGNILWDKKYGASKKYNVLLNIRALDNGDIIACGVTPVDFPHYSGWIIKVNENGDSLWYREYDYLDGPSSRNYLWSVIETTDNELISCGYVLPQLPDTGNRDAWVIKLDSIGCDTVGCDPTVGIEEQGGIEAWEQGSLVVYPNLARDWITLTLPDIVTSGVIDLEIYNIFGQMVMKKEAVPVNKMISLNISYLSSGFYPVICKDSRNNIFKGKFIVGR